MIISISSAEHQSGNYGDFIKVEGVNEKGKAVTKNVSEKFKDKWDLLKQGAVIEFEMEQKDNKWYINDIISVGDNLPPPQSNVTEPLPDKIQKEIHDSNKPKYDPSGQERGMWWKQLGDDLRTGHIDKSSTLGKALRKAYFAEMFKVLDIKIHNPEGE